MATLDSLGFSGRRLEDIVTDLEARWRTIFAVTVNLDISTPEGQIIAIFSEQIILLEELAEATFDSFGILTATGASLDSMVDLLGMARLAASKTQVSCDLTVSAAVTIPAGSQVRVGVGGAIFDLKADAVFVGAGTAPHDFEAVDTGPIPAVSVTIDTIETPVANWTGVINPAGQTELGRDVETDAELRLRARLRVANRQKGAPDALFTAVAAIVGVTEVAVFLNDSDNTVNGLPPHSVNVVVEGGADQDIGDVIWATKAAGIESFGAVAQVVTDLSGNAQTVNFDRFTEVDIHVTVDLITVGAEDALPVTAAVDTAAEILAFGDAHKAGQDVNPFDLVRAITTKGITTVVEKIGLAPSPTTNDVIVIDRDERAAFDAARITVTVDGV